MALLGAPPGAARSAALRVAPRDRRAASSAFSASRFVLIFEANGLGGGRARPSPCLRGRLRRRLGATRRPGSRRSSRSRPHLADGPRGSGEARESAAFQAHRRSRHLARPQRLGAAANAAAPTPARRVGRRHCKGGACSAGSTWPTVRPSSRRSATPPAPTEPVAVQFRLRAGDGGRRAASTAGPAPCADRLARGAGPRHGSRCAPTGSRARRGRRRGRRRDPRHLRAHAARGRARSAPTAPRQGRRGAGAAPRHRQPRIADAAQRDHRLCGAADGRGLGSASDGDSEYAEIIHDSGHHMLGVVSTPARPLDDRGRAARPRAGSPRRRRARAGVLPPPGLDPPIAPASRSRRTWRADLPELHADRRACQQILLNLLSNAVKFTPRGGLVTVQARARRRPASR